MKQVGSKRNTNTMLVDIRRISDSFRKSSSVSCLFLLHMVEVFPKTVQRTPKQGFWLLLPYFQYPTTPYIKLISTENFIC